MTNHLQAVKCLHIRSIWNMRSTAQINQGATPIDGDGFVSRQIIDDFNLTLKEDKR